MVVLFFLALLLSAIETIGVSAVMPFISVASTPDLIDSGWYQYFYRLFGFDDKNRFVISFGIAIIVFYIFRSLFNIFYNYAINKFSLGTFRYFSSRLFKTYLALPYKVYVQKNPSVLAQMIGGEANNLSNVLLRLLQMLSELCTVLFLYCFMLLVNWQITLVLTFILLLIVLIVFATLIRLSK
ncbi:MAG: hypothetical protein LBH70_04055, partial [Spirochaetaceae bacterium]|nr:hypothetical protein [Spirochaetaceae bacterium]